MKILKSILFRSLCAIAIGAMLVKYPEQGRTGFIMAIGALFLVSGIISVASYIFQKRNATAAAIEAEAQGFTYEDLHTPLPPIAGTGSLFLGILLILVPDSIVEFINMLFGAMILVGAFNQFFSLVAARRFAKVPLAYWFLSSVIFIAGVVIILKPQAIADLIIQICGWCFIVYAVQDMLIGIQTAIYKRRFAKKEEQLAEAVEV